MVSLPTFPSGYYGTTGQSYLNPARYSGTEAPLRDRALTVLAPGHPKLNASIGGCLDVVCFSVNNEAARKRHGQSTEIHLQTRFEPRGSKIQGSARLNWEDAAAKENEVDWQRRRFERLKEED